MSRLDAIKQILSTRNQLIKCEHCGFEYMPLTSVASQDCVQCGWTHGLSPEDNWFVNGEYDETYDDGDINE